MTSQTLLQPLPASTATYPGVCLHSNGSLEITVIAMLTSLHGDVKIFLVHHGKAIMSLKMIKTPEGARAKCKTISIQKCETMSHKSIVPKL